MLSVPKPTPAMELGDEAPTALYRLFNARGRLIYIGITGNLRGRLAQHAALKPWWPGARKTVEWHLSRESAADAEIAAIGAEHPACNVQGAVPLDLVRHIAADAVVALVLREMPPTALRLALLEAAGVGTDQALDLLGVRVRQNRSRAKLQRAAAVVPSAAC